MRHQHFADDHGGRAVRQSPEIMEYRIHALERENEKLRAQVSHLKRALRQLADGEEPQPSAASAPESGVAE